MRISQEQLKAFEQQLDSLLESSPTHGLGRSLRSLKKELSAYWSHNGTAKHYHQGKVEKVQIGGGKHQLQGFLNIDIFEPADLVFDLREGIPLNDCATKLIFSEHFMEHIDYPISVKKFVNECYRILETDGQLIIGVPDTRKVLEGYIKNDKQLMDEYLAKWYKNRDCLGHFNTYIDLVNYHMRDQDDSNKYNPHFWGYDFEKLDNLLINAGFSSVHPWEFDLNIANPKREFGSVYVLAKK
jgi:predicted SAM-dependent methyltransferase